MQMPSEMMDMLKQAQRVLIVAHVSPDGDTLGSSLALRLAFLRLGKDVTLVCQDRPAAFYDFLPGVDTVVLPEQVKGTFDTAVAVDVSDSLRLGDCAPVYFACEKRVVIDHHKTNDNFGQCNWIDVNASAVGVMISEVINALGVPLDKAMAVCLYTAISTDTGHFQFGNTNGAAMHAAAAMVDTGIDVAGITMKLYREMPKAKTLLLARALGRMQFAHEDRTAYIALRRADIDECGATDDMTEGIINYAIQTIGVDIAFMATEKEGVVKFSMRSKAPYDVAALCKQFGGGGHALAAGCKMTTPLEESAQIMLGAIAQEREVKA